MIRYQHKQRGKKARETALTARTMNEIAFFVVVLDCPATIPNNTSESLPKRTAKSVEGSILIRPLKFIKCHNFN